MKAALLTGPGFIATRTFPLARVQGAFETVFNYRDGVIKAMVAGG